MAYPINRRIPVVEMRTALARLMSIELHQSMEIRSVAGHHVSAEMSGCIARGGGVNKL